MDEASRSSSRPTNLVAEVCHGRKCGLRRVNQFVGGLMLICQYK